MAQYSDADILIYMYDFDEAFVLDMQKLKKFVVDHFNDEDIQKKYYAKKVGSALNVLIHITKVKDLRLDKYEKMFGTTAFK